jgi:hypothetical protein
MTEHTAATAKHPTTSYVFVCYSHDDRDTVVEQILWLKSQGISVWFDEAIEAGSRWSDDLARAVEGCSAFLYFMSPRSVGSRYCLDEVHFALECGRPIVPVEIAPATLTPGLKLSLGGTHRLFMYQMEAGEFRRKLAKGLGDAMAGGAGTHAIESRPARARRLPLEPAFAVNWRPAVFGVATALAAYIAMMIAAR